MPVTNGYTDRVSLKATLDIASETFADSDIDSAINAASRLVDAYCQRRFYLDASASARQFTSTERRLVRFDDAADVTELATDEDGDGTYETVWVASDFRLEPLNAAAKSEPWTRARVTQDGDHVFPFTVAAVRVTAQWGWPAVPDLVVEATRIQASRLLKRTREAPFGVAGVSFEGAPMRLLNRLDPDVELMLQTLRKWPAVVG